jgi:hypothetical protein
MILEFDKEQNMLKPKEVFAQDDTPKVKVQEAE